jgi:hypothetical protein
VADLPLHARENLADAALENLVNQFARPLDFLRELVQNSIDAGSPRVEVWLCYRRGAEGDGVLEIHVDDFGEGMDEHIIDNHLTRLFSSTKEDDLTKIGKFGIGFTSIFAIQPDAILMRTSRHGESWELLFHPDRSFDKIKSDKMVDGTKLTLFKRMPDVDVEPFVRDSRWILGWWCEHSNTPVTFWDRTDEQMTESQQTDDPFAAFAEGTPETAAGPIQVNRPLDLDGPLSARLTRDGVDAVVSYAEDPRYGYYNGGLTLVSTRNRDVLGGFEPRLAHLSFKLKSDRLEHTLTRDNVLQDEHWTKAMRVLHACADALREKLVERIGIALAKGEEVASWHRWLAQECATPDGPKELVQFQDRPMFRDQSGQPVTLRQVEEQEEDQGVVILSGNNDRLRVALAEEEVLQLEDAVETRDLLLTAWRPPLFAFLDPSRKLATADEVYVLPDVVELGSLSHIERMLVQRVTELLREAVGRRLSLRIGNYGGAELGPRRPLVLEGPPDGRVFQRPEASWLRIPAFLRARCLLLNRHHPFFHLQLTAAAEDLELAAYCVAQALLHTEDAEGDRVYVKLLEAAAE